MTHSYILRRIDDAPGAYEDLAVVEFDEVGIDVGVGDAKQRHHVTVLPSSGESYTVRGLADVWRAFPGGDGIVVLLVQL